VDGGPGNAEHLLKVEIGAERRFALARTSLLSAAEISVVVVVRATVQVDAIALQHLAERLADAGHIEHVPRRRLGHWRLTLSMSCPGTGQDPACRQ